MFKRIFIISFFSSLFSTDRVEYNIPELEKNWKDWSFKRILISKWSKKIHTESKIKPVKNVFYPCGGGDVLFPILVFPNFRKLIMVGLESPGLRFSREDFNPEFISNFRWFLYKGFFVTQNMGRIPKGAGILSLILPQIKKLGAEKIVFAIFKNHIAVKFFLHGAKREIHYFKINLHDDNFNNLKHILDPLTRSDFALLLKSSSFVFQQVGFVKIRNWALKHANLIVQDDTGIAYKLLLKNNYHIKLYGWYQFPYGHPSFKSYFQPDLKEAYEENSELLDFAAGYGSDKIPSNFLVAKKI